jgi:hypothetical protein
MSDVTVFNCSLEAVERGTSSAAPEWPWHQGFFHLGQALRVGLRRIGEKIAGVRSQTCAMVAIAECRFEVGGLVTLAGRSRHESTLHW